MNIRDGNDEGEFGDPSVDTVRSLDSNSDNDSEEETKEEREDDDGGR